MHPDRLRLIEQEAARGGQISQECAQKAEKQSKPVLVTPAVSQEVAAEAYLLQAYEKELDRLGVYRLSAHSKHLGQRQEVVVRSFRRVEDWKDGKDHIPAHQAPLNEKHRKTLERLQAALYTEINEYKHRLANLQPTSEVVKLEPRRRKALKLEETDQERSDRLKTLEARRKFIESEKDPRKAEILRRHFYSLTKEEAREHQKLFEKVKRRLVKDIRGIRPDRLAHFPLCDLIYYTSDGLETEVIPVGESSLEEAKAASDDESDSEEEEDFPEEPFGGGLEEWSDDEILPDAPYIPYLSTAENVNLSPTENIEPSTNENDNLNGDLELNSDDDSDDSDYKPDL